MTTAEQIQKIIVEDLKLPVTFEIIQVDESPLEARQAAILAAFQEEPLSKSEALELIDELAEIQIQLGKDKYGNNSSL